jgi:hypothetical protein
MCWAPIFKEKGDLHDYVNFAEGLLQVNGPNKFNTENWASLARSISALRPDRFHRRRALYAGAQAV